MFGTIGDEDLSRTTPTVRFEPHRRTQTIAVVPAYDEGRRIGSVVLQVKPYVDQVLVVDDGSHDDTAQIAQAAGALVIRHERNRGKGCALNTGLMRARTLGATAVVLIDGDGQHRAEEIPNVLAPILRYEADVVVGSRYLHPHEQVPRHRVLGHKALTWLTNIVSGVHLSDSQNGFRALSARALDVLRFSSHGFSVESEMQFLIREHKLRVTEAPVTTLYPERPKRSVVSHGLQVLDGLVRVTNQYRPLLSYGLPGLVAFMVGLSAAASAIEHLHRAPRLAVGLALAGLPLLGFGTMGLFIGVLLQAMRCLFEDTVRANRVELSEEPESDVD